MTDLIESLLAQLNLRTQVFHRGTHCGSWHLSLEHSDKVLFHFVSDGSCVVEISEPECKIALSRGDLLLIRNPVNHKVRATDRNSDKVPTSKANPGELLPEDICNLICAYVEFDPKVQNPLFDALPASVVVRAGSHADGTWLESLLGLLFAEANTKASASQTVIERLTDILFIHIIRTYVADCPEETGILAAYNDPSLRKVLEYIHNNPEKPWMIADFCSAANLSRSVFIEKFTRTLGVPPMTYLTQQRLEHAYRELREGKRKIIDVALDCGYENESSFSKAFKRMYEISPGAYRRAGLTT